MLQAALTTLGVLGFIALTLGTALFVAAEFSLTALERSTVDEDVRNRNDRRSRQVLGAHKTLSFQLSGAQLGITLTTLITGYIAEPVLATFLKPIFTLVRLPETFHEAGSVVLSLVIATSLSMVLGELVPKNLAIAKPLDVARFTAGPHSLFSRTFGWVIRGLNASANWIVRRLGMEPADELSSARSATELTALVRNSVKHGSIDEHTAQLVERSLSFGDRTAEELMTPRGKVETLDLDDTVLDLMLASERTGFSRFPVIDGDLDDATGVVHIKQAFTVPVAHRKSTRLSTLSGAVAVVPGSLDGDALMGRIRADGMQVALVVDEYGGTAGIVTMEDLIEEIVGNVRDEHDHEDDEVRATADGFVASGLLRIDELVDAVGFRAVEGEYDTLGGLVVYQLGRIPEEGDEVELPSRGVTVRDADESEDDQATDLEVTEAPQWHARVVRMDRWRVDQVELWSADHHSHAQSAAAASEPADG